jgi:hypothetical protein
VSVLYTAKLSKYVIYFSYVLGTVVSVQRGTEIGGL